MGKDNVHIEFELGDLEFEAKGNADVIERMFNHLLKLIEEERIPISRPEEEEVVSGVEELESYEEDSLKPPPEEDIEAPPEWDSLDESSPPESEIEKSYDSEES